MKKCKVFNRMVRMFVYCGIMPGLLIISVGARRYRSSFQPPMLPVSAQINTRASVVGGTKFSSLASNFTNGAQLNIQQGGATIGSSINAGSASAGSSRATVQNFTGANLQNVLGNRSDFGAGILYPSQTGALIDASTKTKGALNVKLKDVEGAGTLGNLALLNQATVQGGVIATGDATGSQNETSVIGNPYNPYA